MDYKFLLPIILLCIQFFYKFFTDRRVTAYNFILEILEIPISILFISLSLIAGFIISATKGNFQLSFIYFISILILLFICILLWRRSTEHFEKKNFWRALLLGVFNLSLSLPILIYIIYYLTGSEK